MLSSEMLAIYEKIPHSKCKPGCCKCCTNVIQFSPSELVHMGSYANDGCCSHCVDGKCAIYENRPFICRIYGTSELLVCEDCEPERYLTAEETTELVHIYRELWKAEENTVKD